MRNELLYGLLGAGIVLIALLVFATGYMIGSPNEETFRVKIQPVIVEKIVEKAAVVQVNVDNEKESCIIINGEKTERCY